MSFILENYEHGKYVFVPNHVSEFDGVLFGIIIPHMLVVAKSDWVSNPCLNGFVEKFFSIVGVRRKDKSTRVLGFVFQYNYYDTNNEEVYSNNNDNCFDDIITEFEFFSMG